MKVEDYIALFGTFTNVYIKTCRQDNDHQIIINKKLKDLQGIETS
jgi:hypothetical protein